MCLIEIKKKNHEHLFKQCRFNFLPHQYPPDIPHFFENIQLCLVTNSNNFLLEFIFMFISSLGRTAEQGCV